MSGVKFAGRNFVRLLLDQGSDERAECKCSSNSVLKSQAVLTIDEFGVSPVVCRGARDSFDGRFELISMWRFGGGAMLHQTTTKS